MLVQFLHTNVHAAERDRTEWTIATLAWPSWRRLSAADGRRPLTSPSRPWTASIRSGAATTPSPPSCQIERDARPPGPSDPSRTRIGRRCGASHTRPRTSSRRAVARRPGARRHSRLGWSTPTRRLSAASAKPAGSSLPSSPCRNSPAAAGRRSQAPRCTARAATRGIRAGTPADRRAAQGSPWPSGWCRMRSAPRRVARPSGRPGSPG